MLCVVLRAGLTLSQLQTSRKTFGEPIGSIRISAGLIVGLVAAGTLITQDKVSLLRAPKS